MVVSGLGSVGCQWTWNKWHSVVTQNNRLPIGLDGLRVSMSPEEREKTGNERERSTKVAMTFGREQEKVCVPQLDWILL